MGAERRQFTHEAAERRAGGGKDDDGVGSWLELLREDPRAIFTAASGSGRTNALKAKAQERKRAPEHKDKRFPFVSSRRHGILSTIYLKDATDPTERPGLRRGKLHRLC